MAPSIRLGYKCSVKRIMSHKLRKLPKGGSAGWVIRNKSKVRSFRTADKVKVRQLALHLFDG
jgi:hypothetical protein